MTIEECYQKLGGSPADVLKRLPSEAFVKKFLIKFLDDTSYNALLVSMENKNQEEAFRAAHTIKGICLNLGLKNLGDVVEKLTEALRPTNNTEITETAVSLLEDVKKAYAETMDAIRQLQAS